MVAHDARLRLRSSLPRRWRWRSLAIRIMAVNLLALIGLAGGIAYLDSFRSRMLEQRRAELVAQTRVVAAMLDMERVAATASRSGRDRMLAAIPVGRGTHIRVYDADGALLADNWRVPGQPRFRMVDPATQGFPRRSAVAIDRAIELLTGAPALPPYDEPAADHRRHRPEVWAAAGIAPPGNAPHLRRAGDVWVAERMGGDRIVIQQAAAALGDGPQPRPVVTLTSDTADVLNSVRDERANIALYFLALLGVTLALSGYLARTIVKPLRQLALAAHRVRLGRARDVAVPRLPGRRDEIGALARALSDMTATLRHRIDATEAFAADVAHELKNPLASLRSAVEALGAVRRKEHREQLFEVINADVRRIDRLITDISAASRLDAELSRARLEPVAVGDLIERMVSSMRAAGQLPRGIDLHLHRADDDARVLGEPGRLGQVFGNLIDNAISFSAEGSTVIITVERHGEHVRVMVDDEGPGVPPEARTRVFERFYSERPDGEDYGKHSGLGLSIARAIVETLDGRIHVAEAPGGGARFVVELPTL